MEGASTVGVKGTEWEGQTVTPRPESKEDPPAPGWKRLKRGGRAGLRLDLGPRGLTT